MHFKIEKINFKDIFDGVIEWILSKRIRPDQLTHIDKIRADEMLKIYEEFSEIIGNKDLVIIKRANSMRASSSRLKLQFSRKSLDLIEKKRLGNSQYFINIGIKLLRDSIKCLIDTGAGTSHVTIDLVQGLPVRELENNYFQLNYFNNKHHITHKVDLVIILQEYEIPMSIEVEDSVSIEFLLGMDFLCYSDDYAIKDRYLEIAYNGKRIEISRV